MDEETDTRRVALVTGGAVRVGRAISLGLAAAGWHVAVNYHASEDAAESVAERIRDTGVEALLVQGDVSRADDVEKVVSDVRRRFGRLDLLVNNASIFPEGDLLEVTEEAWDRALDVNLKGPFLTVKAAADLLRASRGSVVNVVDNSAFQPWSGHPQHSISKAGLLHLTRLQARALAPEARANAVSPGPVLLPEGTTEEERLAAAGRTLVKRLGSPEDVVRTVLFLAESPFVTGEVIVVDGGTLANR